MLDIRYIKEIARQTGADSSHVKTAIGLMDDGCTIPFIARYRSYLVGTLDETLLGIVADRLSQFQKLHKKKLSTLESYTQRGILDSQLRSRIEGALSDAELEEICLPYKQKRKTKADAARELGLEPLCQTLLKTRRKDRVHPVQEFRKGSKLNEKEIWDGLFQLIGEDFSLFETVRREFRRQLQKFGVVSSRLKKGAEPSQSDTYRIYYDFSKPIRFLKAYQVLALLRGSREGILTVKFSLSQEERCFERCLDLFGIHRGLRYFEQLKEGAWLGFKKKLLPSLERELRALLMDSAVESALGTFSSNLKDLLLTRPIKGKVILGMDPGFKAGCKCAVIDEFGGLKDTFTFYPVLDPKRRDDAISILKAKILKFSPDLIAIGNGTACQETTRFVSDCIGTLSSQKPKFMQVSEAGASVYSASPQAVEEFGHLPIQVRGAISIARRVQDPLAEYVKVPIEALGVGLYQHDIPKARLKESLQRVVQSAVSCVGLDLNTASTELLSLLPGLSPRLAANVVSHRAMLPRGFQSRKDLLLVEGIGKSAFTQAAGFCRVPESGQVFDRTIVHPESYDLAAGILQMCSSSPRSFLEQRERISDKLNQLDRLEAARKLGEDEAIMGHVIQCLLAPTNDPREELPLPLLREEVLKLESLSPGLELTGVVRNIVEFGLFMDIGVGVDGLLHQSRRKFSSKPLEDQYAIGQQFLVRVVEVDVKRKRIALEESA